VVPALLLCHVGAAQIHLNSGGIISSSKSVVRAYAFAARGTCVQCKINVVNLPVSELDLGENRWLLMF
jgi:hypothetical protein